MESALPLLNQVYGLIRPGNRKGLRKLVSPIFAIIVSSSISSGKELKSNFVERIKLLADTPPHG
jgi:hypothetical protein